MRSGEGLYREYYGMSGGGSNGVIFFVIVAIVTVAIGVSIVLANSARW